MLFSRILEDVRLIRQWDPACNSTLEALLCYPGLQAVWFHVTSHWLYRRRLFFLARLVSQFARFLTGVDIHPGAAIGRAVIIDHGIGVVIGETAEVEDHVVLFHEVTLGSTGPHRGKRHPTIRRNVFIGAGAKILGPIEIGEGSKVGSGAVIIESVPPNTTIVAPLGAVIRRRSHEG